MVVSTFTLVAVLLCWVVLGGCLVAAAIWYYARWLVVALVATAVLLLTHPMPEIPLFDTPLIAHEMQTRTLWGGVQYMAGYRADYPRPARAVEWWLMARAFGASPRAYHVVNALGVGAMLGATAALSKRLTGRWALTTLLTGVSYATVYPLLHFPYGWNVALGLGGLALVWSGWRVGWACMLWAALAHECNALFLVLPFARRYL